MKIRTITVKSHTYYQLDLGMHRGKRIRRNFTSEADAKAALRREEKRRRNQGDMTASLPARVMLELVECHERAQRLGITLSGLLDAHESGRMVRGAVTGGVTINDAVRETIAAKESEGRAHHYLRNYRPVLDRFARAFDGRLITEVTHTEIANWLSVVGGKDGGRTIRGRISTVFSTAMTEGWIANNPISRLPKIRTVSEAPTILTPMQWARVLVYTRKHEIRHLPWVILAGMEGVRPFEADQIQAEDIDLEHGLLTIKGAYSKTRRHRVIELSPSTVRWLQWAFKNGGELGASFRSRGNFLRRCARRALHLKSWPTDVLRHTAASVMCAIWKDAPKVALHLGNSVPVIMRHYNNSMPARIAERYFHHLPM
jgi:hypothetical protein